MKIRTNRHIRPFLYRDEVPKKVLESQFDHLKEDEVIDGFFKYRNCWYRIATYTS